MNLNGKVIMKIIPVLTVLLFLLAGCGTEDGVVQPRGNNIILVIIDTLRADHLSCYGYQRLTTPVIDSIAADGTLWTNAYSQAPWTLPSHASIWTGLSVRAHGTNHIGGIDGFDMKLDDDLPVIPALVRGSGLQTAGFTTFVLLSEEFGFNRGFDHYNCEGSGTQSAQVTIDLFLHWLDTAEDDRNFFSVIHLYDVHAPYTPVPPFDEAFSETGFTGVKNWDITEDGIILNPEDRDYLVSMYDGEILYVDDQIGRLVSELRQRGLWDNTVLIITSDHGEEFLEHGGVGHGHALYNEQLHVPLIMSGPGVDSGMVVEQGAALYDLLPTILGLLEIPVPPGIEGRNLLELAEDERPIPSSGVSPDRFFLANTPLDNFQSCAVVSGDDKVIAYMELDSMLQFDLNSDPGEFIPFEADSVMEEMALYYWATPRLGDPQPLTEMTDQVVQTLRDLGYVR